MLQKRSIRRGLALSGACASLSFLPALAKAQFTVDQFQGDGGTYSWNDPTAWSFGVPTPDTFAIFPVPGSTTTVDLQGSQTVDQIYFSNTGSGSGSATYLLTDGALTTNGIGFALTDNNFPFFTPQSNEIDASVTSNNSQLGISATGGTLAINGQILVNTLNYTGSANPGFPAPSLILGNSTNSINSINIGGGFSGTPAAELVASAAGAFGNGTTINASAGSAITFVAEPFFSADVYNNSINVAASGVKIGIQAPASFSPGSGTAAITSLNFTTEGTINFESNHNAHIEFNTTFLSGNTTIHSFTNDPGTRAYVDLGDVSVFTVGAALTADGQGTVSINFGSIFGNVIANNGMIVANGPNSFGFTATDVYANTNGTIYYNTAQVPLHNTHVQAFGGVGGQLDNAVFSGPNQNIFLSENSIIVPPLSGTFTLPHRGTDIDHPAYFRGLTDSNSLFLTTVGEDPSHQSIYKGVAFGDYTDPVAGSDPVPGPYSGDIKTYDGHTPIQVFLNDGSWNLSQVEFETADTTLGVHFQGLGGAIIGPHHSPTDATVFTATGSTNSDSTNTTILAFSASNTIAAGDVVHLTNGALLSNFSDAVTTGGTVNVHNTGTYIVGGGDFNDASPTSGIFNIDAGGAVVLRTAQFTGTSPTLDQGGQFHFAAGSQLVFDPGTFVPTIDTGSPTWIPANADIVVKSPGNNFFGGVDFTGSGLVLGNGRRLTTAADGPASLEGSVGVFAAPGATSIRFSAAFGQTLVINEPVSIPGVDLNIGDDLSVTPTYTTIADQTARVAVAQTGVVEMNTLLARDVNLLSGDAYVFSTLTARNVNMLGTGNLSLYAIGMALSGSLNVSAGDVSVIGSFAYGHNASVNVTGGRVEFDQFAATLLTDARHQMTIGVNGQVTDGGSFDPFSDTAGHMFNIHNDGSLQLFSSTRTIGAISGSGAMEMFGSALSVESIRQASLDIDAASASVRPNGGSLGVSRLSALSIDTPSGSQLDLNDNDLIVDYATGSSPIATIQSYLAAGYDAGHWDGAGIISSTASHNSTPLTALGYGDAQDLGITTLDGQLITGHAVIVKYTYYGDASLDGKVDLANDFNLFLQGFLTPGSSTWELGDFNYDGVVDVKDFRLFVDGFAAHGGQLGQLDVVIAGSPLSVTQKRQLLAVVPEPTTASLILGASLLMLRRRSKRS